MQYFYAILWFVIGLILIFSVSKENKIFYFAGGFFFLLGGWWLADACLPNVNLFDGAWGLSLKCVSGVCLVILAICFAREYKKGKAAAKKDEEKEE